jgi:hypothetical protein
VRVLLDTHVLLWWLLGNPRLSSTALELRVRSASLDETGRLIGGWMAVLRLPHEAADFADRYHSGTMGVGRSWRIGSQCGDAGRL